jgi:4-amino-4-deoxy-L-arabinose transferase-like glycosyltransferase
MSARRRPPLVPSALACFAIGAGLLLAFDKAVTLALGIVLLLAFIVLGVFAIASPEYLAREPDDPPG